MLIVTALGGNALLRRGEPLDAETQRANVRCAAASIAELASEHAVVVTHGNGPQVGLLARQAEACSDVPPYPLDVLGAESEGMIGYLLEQELRMVLPDREVATLLTQVEVDPDDSAFAEPAKPIGRVYAEADARELERRHGWSMTRQARGGYRRVVPSPEPTRILEMRAIRLLVAAQVLVICAGGGGIPVAVTESGGLRGMDAVIDKDLASALLATSLGADALLLLTDQPAVFADWPEPARHALGEVTPEQLRAYTFEPGSMAPKVEAACRFTVATGSFAGIGALHDAPQILRGRTGTRVRRG